MVLAVVDNVVNCDQLLSAKGKILIKGLYLLSEVSCCHWPETA
jgi:hypothetical protein